jgi:hypothetical protein
MTKQSGEIIGISLTVNSLGNSGTPCQNAQWNFFLINTNGEYRARTGGLCGAIATRYQLR